MTAACEPPTCWDCGEEATHWWGCGDDNGISSANGNNYMLPLCDTCDDGAIAYTHDDDIGPEAIVRLPLDCPRVSIEGRAQVVRFQTPTELCESAPHRHTEPSANLQSNCRGDRSLMPWGWDQTLPVGGRVIRFRPLIVVCEPNITE
jgi:hypothetical protein